MNLFRYSMAVLMLAASLCSAGRSWGEAVPEATSLWTLRFPGSFNASSSTPAIAPDGTLYLGTFQGKLLAVTPQGGLKWIFDINCEIKSSPAIAADGTVYFGSRNRKFYALTPAGKLKWMFPTGGWVDSSPAIAADGTVCFGSADKSFYALNPDGSEKWKFPVGAKVDSSPAIAADGTIYFGAHDKKFYALNPGGRLSWAFLTGGPIVSSPAIGANGIIYFSSLDGNLYALTPSGSELWHYHSGSTTDSSPVIDEDGNICIGNNVNTLIVTPGGKLSWGLGSAVPMNTCQAAVTGEFYFSRPWRQMLGITLNGKLAWQMDLPANVSASLVVGADGTFYVVDEFDLYSVRPPQPVLLSAKSSWPMFRANARHTGRVVD
jgi:outer membrane protein assembly factor BamB